MTHFVGLVVAEAKAELNALLQPYHEYECTGLDDEYVIDNDITEEARETFAKDTETCLRGPDGKLHSFFTPDGNWDVRFSQAKPLDYRPDNREKFVPPGYEEVTVPSSELLTFEAWAASYYGSDTVKGEGDNVSIVKRTNPNAEWDWWVVGGRWSDVGAESFVLHDLPRYFPDYIPSVLVDADGWHQAKDWGWFGSSSPSDTPDIVKAKIAEHGDKRVWVVDFHI